MKAFKALSIALGLLFIAPSFTSCSSGRSMSASGHRVTNNGTSKASKHRSHGSSCGDRRNRRVRSRM